MHKLLKYALASTFLQTFCGYHKHRFNTFAPGCCLISKNRDENLSHLRF